MAFDNPQSWSPPVSNTNHEDFITSSFARDAHQLPNLQWKSITNAFRLNRWWWPITLLSVARRGHTDTGCHAGPLCYTWASKICSGIYVNMYRNVYICTRYLQTTTMHASSVLSTKLWLGDTKRHPLEIKNVAGQARQPVHNNSIACHGPLQHSIIVSYFWWCDHTLQDLYHSPTVFWQVARVLVQYILGL